MEKVSSHLLVKFVVNASTGQVAQISDIEVVFSDSTRMDFVFFKLTYMNMPLYGS